MERSERSRQLAASPLGWMPGDPPAPGRRFRSRRSMERWVERQDHRLDPTKERWHLIVSGHVQGVGYRQACCEQARHMGLGGWVRNRSDGGVELEAEGPHHRLNELRLWCERGPSRAVVLGVAAAQVTPMGTDWFEVLH